MDDRPSDALSQVLDRQIEDLLDIQPSAGFTTRVRLRVEREAMSSGWWRSRWATAAMGTASAGIVFAVMTFQSRPAEWTASPAPIASQRVMATSMMAPGPAMFRPWIHIATERTAMMSEPEVLIDAGETAALRRLLSRVQPAPAHGSPSENRVGEVAALPALGDVSVSPLSQASTITIEPLVSMAFAEMEGEPQ